MIIQNISGGIGNQMFKYAYARALSLDKNEKIYMEMSTFKSDDSRKYELDRLNISNDVELIKEKPLLNIIFKVNLFFHMFIYKCLCVKDINGAREWLSRRGFYISGERKNNDAKYYGKWMNYYCGLFQNEDFFHNHADVIKKELQVKYTVSEACEKLGEEMNKTNSVCVHIRRGDYLNSPIHKVCDADYYKRAINIMREKIESPVFYFFSDDIKWVQQNFCSSEFKIVNISQIDVEDLYLMYHCNNFIIPNSTFSWWGQYLSENENKIVIAPDRWYNNMPVDCTNIFMDSWITIEP